MVRTIREMMLEMRKMREEMKRDSPEGNKKERERRRSNVVVKGLGDGSDVGADVGKVWERMGLGVGGIKEVVRIGRTGKGWNGAGEIGGKRGRLWKQRVS